MKVGTDACIGDKPQESRRPSAQDLYRSGYQVCSGRLGNQQCSLDLRPTSAAPCVQPCVSPWLLARTANGRGLSL